MSKIFLVDGGANIVYNKGEDLEKLLPKEVTTSIYDYVCENHLLSLVALLPASKPRRLFWSGVGEGIIRISAYANFNNDPYETDWGYIKLQGRFNQNI